MIHTIVKIQRLGDGPVFPEHADCVTGSVLGVAVVERGTASGQTVVGVMAEINGCKGFLQFTLGTFNAIAAAANGADMRFRDQAKNN